MGSLNVIIILSKSFGTPVCPLCGSEARTYGGVLSTIFVCEGRGVRDLVFVGLGEGEGVQVSVFVLVGVKDGIEVIELVGVEVDVSVGVFEKDGRTAIAVADCVVLFCPELSIGQKNIIIITNRTTPGKAHPQAGIWFQNFGN